MQMSDPSKFQFGDKVRFHDNDTIGFVRGRSIEDGRPYDTFLIRFAVDGRPTQKWVPEYVLEKVEG